MSANTVQHLATQTRSRLVTVGLETLLLDVAKQLAGPRIQPKE